MDRITDLTEWNYNGFRLLQLELQHNVNPEIRRELIVRLSSLENPLGVYNQISVLQHPIDPSFQPIDPNILKTSLNWAADRMVELLMGADEITLNKQAIHTNFEDLFAHASVDKQENVNSLRLHLFSLQEVARKAAEEAALALEIKKAQAEVSVLDGPVVPKAVYLSPTHKSGRRTISLVPPTAAETESDSTLPPVLPAQVSTGVSADHQVDESASRALKALLNVEGGPTQSSLQQPAADPDSQLGNSGMPNHNADQAANSVDLDGMAQEEEVARKSRARLSKSVRMRQKRQAAVSVPPVKSLVTTNDSAAGNSTSGMVSPLANGSLAAENFVVPSGRTQPKPAPEKKKLKNKWRWPMAKSKVAASVLDSIVDSNDHLSFVERFKNLDYGLQKLQQREATSAQITLAGGIQFMKLLEIIDLEEEPVQSETAEKLSAELKSDGYSAWHKAVFKARLTIYLASHSLAKSSQKGDDEAPGNEIRAPTGRKDQ